MFNSGSKKEAIQALHHSEQEHKGWVEKVLAKMAELLALRQRSSIELKGRLQRLMAILPDDSKEFDVLRVSVRRYEIAFQKFTQTLKDLQIKSDNTSIKLGTSAAAGVVAGVGTATFVPTVAMAIATTFGTASTGTAIATLSGAAATNASLAWLGGGALAAGGGGYGCW